MRLHAYFVSLSLAGLLLGHPVIRLADDNVAGPQNLTDSVGQGQMPEFTTEAPPPEPNPAASFEMAE